MAIEVIRAEITVPERHFTDARKGLRFVAAGQEMNLAEQAYAMLERAGDPLNMYVDVAGTPDAEAYNFELTDVVGDATEEGQEFAGLLFVGDGATEYNAFAELVTGQKPDEDDGPFFEGQEWPVLGRVWRIASGIVIAQSKIGVHLIEEGETNLPPAMEGLAQNASSPGRLTVAAMHTFLESLRTS